MKALIILNLEDCTFDEIEEAEIKEINLVYQDKETGKKYDFLWETGFKIKPMPEFRDEHYKSFSTELSQIINSENRGYNDCLREILGEENAQDNS